MNIACLGWGSLVWDPRDLPVRRPWFVDGPLLPIEFARGSDDKRITLVITPKTALVRSLWALCSIDDLNQARILLAERESPKAKDIKQVTGAWNGEKTSEPNCARIADWARQRGIEAVLWTNLRPKVGKVERIPSLQEVLQHLKMLPYEQQRHAERYIRMAPRQIDTEYRRAIEREFGWTCLSEI